MPSMTAKYLPVSTLTARQGRGEDACAQGGVV